MRNKRVDDKAPLAGFEASFHTHLAKIFRSSDLTTALVSNSHRVAVLLRCSKQKKLLSDWRNQKSIPLDGTPWEAIPMHRFRIKSNKRKRKFTFTPEHKYNKYLKFSAKKANLLSDEVAEYVSSLNFAMNADQSERAIVQLESWLNRIIMNCMEVSSKLHLVRIVFLRLSGNSPKLI